MAAYDSFLIGFWQGTLEPCWLLTNTSQVRADGPPHSYTACPEALANGKLQQEERSSFQDQQDKVGDHKCT